MNMRFLIYMGVVVLLATIFFTTGWEDAHPDYYRLEMAARTVSTILCSGMIIGAMELGFWLGRKK